jgi:hypothetical protein
VEVKLDSVENALMITKAFAEAQKKNIDLGRQGARGGRQGCSLKKGANIALFR